MANVVRWDPFAELDQMRNLMDRVFSDFRPLRMAQEGPEVGYFPLDISETDEGYDIEAALPGVKPEDVDIQVHGDTVTIKGETKHESEEKGRNWLRRERRHGVFARSFTLPSGIDSDMASADFENGVLKLHLPKSEAEKPKSIKVGSQRMIEGKKS